MNGLSILIPIKVSSVSALKGFKQTYQKLLTYSFLFKLQIVIADESPLDIFEQVDNWFKDYEEVTHFCPEAKYRNGKNDKLNGIYAALNELKFDYVMLVDDHYRLTPDNLIELMSLFPNYDCFKCMVQFEELNVTALIDVSGIFIVNLIHPYHQFFGHLCLNLNTLKQIGFPHRDGLFDELVIELKFRKHNSKIYFADRIFLQSIQNIKWKKFLEQRVRYAYENLAFPFRFVFFLSILPLLILISIYDFKVSFEIIMFLTLTVITISYLGQVRYGNNKFPAWTFLLAPVWFWFYPFTSWISVFLRFTGGVYFGGRKIIKAI